MAGTQLPEGFSWKEDPLYGSYDSGTRWLMLAGAPIAAVHSCLDGRWLVSVNRHRGIEYRNPTAKYATRESGMRHAERWAIANQVRLRAETAPKPRTLKS